MPSDPDVLATYRFRFEGYLEVLARRIEAHLASVLVGIPNIDRVSARAKEPSSFADKASRLDEAGGLQYPNPLEEIQDQIGARVTVLYLSDVNVVETHLTRYLQPIESQAMEPESEWSFGYFGHHLMVALPLDLLQQDIPRDEVPDFFEVQIKTVFQHAWSEANHDLGYKAPVPLNTDQSRWLAFAASQAWGADRAVDELRRELERSLPTLSPTNNELDAND